MKKLLTLLNALFFISSFSSNYYRYNIPETQNIIGNGQIIFDTRNDPTYNGTSFNLNGSGAPFDVLFRSGTTTDYLKSGSHAFQKLSFSGIDPGNRNTVRLRKIGSGGSAVLYTQRIILDNIILRPDQVDVILRAENGSSQIDMKNSEIDMSQGGLKLNPGGTFVLNSLASTNRINNWDYNITNTFDIYIAPNSNLVFSDSILDMEGDTFIDIRKGKLTIEGDSSEFIMKEKNSIVELTSGEILIKDNGVSVELQNLNSDLGKITVDGDNTKLNLYGMTNIKDTSISLKRGAIQIDKADFSGANGIEIEDNTDFNISSGVSDGVLVIDNSKGGTFKSSNFDINSGTVVYNGSSDSSKNVLGTANINNGNLEFSKDTALTGDLTLNDGYLKFNSNNLVGSLRGSGGTISGNVGVSGGVDMSGSVYKTTLNTNNLQESDMISSATSITGLNNISVEGSSVDARDYENKKFTVAKAPSVDGNKSVSYGSSLPALLRFDVVDDSGAGDQEIGLIGRVNSTTSLAVHPSLTNTKDGKSTSNAKQVVKILPPTGNGGTQPVLTPGAQKLQSALLTMTNAQVSQNLNSLHAEPYSSHLTIGLEQNDLFLNMVMDHAAPRRDVYHSKAEKSSREVVPATENNIWVDTAYVSGDVDGEDGLGDFSYRLTNVIVGGDIYERGYLSLGIYGGYGYHKMDEHDSVTQEFETDTYHVGTYGSYRYDNWVFTGMFGYAYGRNDTERDVVVGTSSGKSGDTFDSHSFYTGVRAAYPVKIGENTTVTPNAGMSYSYIYQEEVKESGFDMADLVVDSADADSFITSLGLHMEYEDRVGVIPVRPMAFIRYEHDWSANSDSSHEVDAAFRHTPDDKTTFSGRNRGKNLVLVGAGMEVEVTPSLLIGGGISYSDDSNGREKGVSLSFEYLWD